MSIRHLDCAGLLPRVASPLVFHVLVVETARGLALVDTGMPTPGGRASSARRQLGAEAADVRDIVLTHLDFDHVGGLADFPDATVHTTAAEHSAALVAPDWHDRVRYRRGAFAHGPRWRLYDGPGETWREGLTGFPVDGLDEIALIPMPGHTRGHAAVGVTDGQELVVHAGDAAFDGSSYRPSLGRNPALRAFEQAVGRDRRAIARNHRALADLDARPGVSVVNAHDPRLMPGRQQPSPAGR